VTPRQKVALARVAWGACLLAAPQTLCRASGAPDPSPALARLIRILGARQLGQALLTTLVAGRWVRLAGIGADAVHGGTAVLYAVARPRWRKPALVDATVAWAFAGLTAGVS
jgi:hypothetical protein